MVIRGIVKNGMIVLDPPIVLPEGVEVRVETLSESAPQSMAEQYGDLIGQAQGLPADFAAQHDHYIHGAPRR